MLNLLICIKFDCKPRKAMLKVAYISELLSMLVHLIRFRPLSVQQEMRFVITHQKR